MEKPPGSDRGRDRRTELPSSEDLPETLPEALPEDLPEALMPFQICVYYAANRSSCVGRPGPK